MYKLLVVDDEQKIRQLIRKYAEFEGFSVDEAADGMEAVNMCRRVNYDLVIMDVMMPELDGFSAVARIRESSDVPVLMLSARGEEYDKIHGFELGVDDYVIKPFSPKELMMRIKAIIARTRPGGFVQNEILEFGGLKIDTAAMVVTVDGERIELSPKGYELLLHLARNNGIAMTRERLLSEVWGYDFFGDDRTLDTHIKLLRSALGGYRDYIVTLRGVGYRFEA